LILIENIKADIVSENVGVRNCCAESNHWRAVGKNGRDSDLNVENTT
jgi:hypothetical protein